MHTTTRLMLAAGLASLAALAPSARAQLRADQVLVVYDSRIADSIAVAEYYAGSASVPNGPGAAGGTPRAGVRKGVRVLDLATTGAGVTTPGNISFADYQTRLRDPIRTHLTARNLATRVRCLVTTKGLPHRVQDSDNPNVGDLPSSNPGSFIPELLANDANCAAVESELTLLYQNIQTGEAGGSADSRTDGLITNPFWRSTTSINTHLNTTITSQKIFSSTGTGPLWTLPGGAGSSTRLNPGEILLTARLDANSVADVFAMLDRAQGFLYNPTQHVLVFDEDPNNLDAVSASFPSLGGGNDYQLAQSALTTDGRFPASTIRSNTLAGASQFLVGPRLTFQAGQGIIVPDPLIFLAHYGANHDGVPSLSTGQSANTTYGTSFNLAPGAIFNTIESFNCRAFGGLTNLSFAAQQQAADYLAAGGTFAVGNVWEPLADTIPDNQQLVSNFVLGTMTWGEAAWSSIPALSWMQTVIGDPLARAQRTTEDTTGNNRVTINDLHLWEGLPASDPRKDVNRNGSSTPEDRALVVATLRAEERTRLLGSR